MRSGVVAGEMMKTGVLPVRPGDPVYDVVSTMLKKGWVGVPVVDDDGLLEGLISYPECIRALLRAVGERTPPTLVGDVMLRDVPAVTEDTHMLTLAHLFRAHGVNTLPVLRDGRPVGMVGRHELLVAATEVFGEAPTREAAILYLSALDRDPPAWGRAPTPVARRRR